MSAVHRHILILSSWFPNRLDPHVGNFIQRYAALLARNYEVSVIHTIGDRSCKRIEVDEQMIDGAMQSGSVKFILHYNFPSFSTGEVKPNRGPGRREIGHGNLAMRALKKEVDVDFIPV